MFAGKFTWIKSFYFLKLTNKQAKLPIITPFSNLYLLFLTFLNHNYIFPKQLHKYGWRRHSRSMKITSRPRRWPHGSIAGLSPSLPSASEDYPKVADKRKSYFCPASPLKLVCNPFSVAPQPSPQFGRGIIPLITRRRLFNSFRIKRSFSEGE